MACVILSWHATIYVPLADPEQRSSHMAAINMAAIKGRDTQPEVLVRRFLHRNGFRYRLHRKDLPGKPDIVLPKYKTVINVNGCFLAFS